MKIIKGKIITLTKSTNIVDLLEQLDETDYCFITWFTKEIKNPKFTVFWKEPYMNTIWCLPKDWWQWLLKIKDHIIINWIHHLYSDKISVLHKWNYYLSVVFLSTADEEIEKLYVWNPWNELVFAMSLMWKPNQLLNMNNLYIDELHVAILTKENILRINKFEWYKNMTNTIYLPI